MKQIIWIYGKKGTGKTEFCVDFAKNNKLDIRKIDRIGKYSDLEKYTGQKVAALTCLNPETCNPDLLCKILNDFRYNCGYFYGHNCNVLFITTWYAPEEYCQISEFAFNEKYKTSKEKVLTYFKYNNVYCFDDDINKRTIMFYTASKMN